MLLLLLLLWPPLNRFSPTLVLLLYLGGRTLDLIWTYIAPAPNSAGIFISFFQFEVAQVAQVVKSVLDWNWLGYDGVLQSVINFLIAGPATFFSSHPLYATVFTLWFLVLWAIFGGVMASASPTRMSVGMLIWRSESR